MIKKQSDDPDVKLAAEQALEIINGVLSKLNKANEFDYGGHILHLGEYDVCSTCTIPIAEAQQAKTELLRKAENIEDPLIKEHLEIAAQLFQLESDAAIVRAELHNGIGTEKILNTLLGFIHEREIFDKYQHSHNGGK